MLVGSRCGCVFDVAHFCVRVCLHMRPSVCVGAHTDACVRIACALVALLQGRGGGALRDTFPTSWLISQTFRTLRRRRYFAWQASEQRRQSSSRVQRYVAARSACAVVHSHSRAETVATDSSNVVSRPVRACMQEFTGPPLAALFSRSAALPHPRASRLEPASVRGLSFRGGG